MEWKWFFSERKGSCLGVILATFCFMGSFVDWKGERCRWSGIKHRHIKSPLGENREGFLLSEIQFQSVKNPLKPVSNGDICSNFNFAVADGCAESAVSCRILCCHQAALCVCVQIIIISGNLADIFHCA